MSLIDSKAHRILIVEDETIVSLDLEASLERLGYQISGSAISGEEALQCIEKSPPDLVLMDIQLSGAMDGIAAAEEIGQHLDIPVVFLTANVKDETITRAKLSGSYGFLNKPFRPQELDATIEIALHQHETGQRERRRLAEQVQLASEALGQSREELQALSRHLMTVQEEERRRIARELHDDFVQQTALLSMQLSDLEALGSPAVRDKIAAFRAGLNTLAEGLREVSHRLHPSILEDLGLREALDALVADFRDQGLAIQTSLGYLDDIPHAVSTSLYRIAQESLRNALKHASASVVRVVLGGDRREVYLRITDNGQGFSLQDVRHQGGLGLISMQERARLVGGSLLLTATPTNGTTVLVRVPLEFALLH